MNDMNKRNMRMIWMTVCHLRGSERRADAQIHENRQFTRDKLHELSRIFQECHSSTLILKHFCQINTNIRSERNSYGLVKWTGSQPLRQAVHQACAASEQLSESHGDYIGEKTYVVCNSDIKIILIKVFLFITKPFLL
jgi:hypothetical protein